MKTPFEVKLSQLNNYTTVNLSYSKLGNAGVKDLAATLENNTTLTSINLEYNEIGAAGVKDLAAALEKNTTLTSINLEYNKIDAAGAKGLAAALEKNNALTSLNLGGNQINDAGAKDFAATLEKNNTLTSINLRYNLIGDAGAKDLAVALEKNTTLTSIDLGYNKIGAAGVEDLAAALKNNYTLLELKGGTGPTISAYLKRNKKIADCLHTFNNAVKKGHLLHEVESSKTAIDSIAAMEAILTQLELLLPDLHSLSQDSYPAQVYRLIVASLYFSGGEEASRYALHSVLSPFKHYPFQRIADKSLGLLLSGDFAEQLKENNLVQEGLLLSLYGFRNHLQDLEIKTFAYMALFKLIGGKGEDYTYQQKQSMEASTLILTQKEILSVLEKAQAQLAATHPASCEAQLIKALRLSQASYYFSLPTACQSNTFVTLLKAQYPKVQAFTTIEHCLLTASNQQESFLLPLNNKLKQEISEEHMAEYGWQLIQDKTQPLSEMVLDLKQTLAKHFVIEEEAADESDKQDIAQISQKPGKQSTSTAGFFQPFESQNDSQAQSPKYSSGSSNYGSS